MRDTVASLLLFSLAAIPSFALAQSNAAPAPEIFSSGVISGPGNDGTPTFTPDGKTLYFTRSGATWTVIMESHRVGDRWSEPVIAPFSGEWSDMQPVLSRDGSFLLFSSTRPTPAGDKALAKGAYIWRVDRVGKGWSDPKLLPEAVNMSTRIFKPTLAADGTIYFMEAEKGTKFRIFRSQFADGSYQKAEPLPFTDAKISDVDPEIAPDESFLIFSSDGRSATDSSHEQMYITFRNGAGWSPVAPLPFAADKSNGGSNDNEAHLSHDGTLIYFASDRTVTVPIPRTREQTKQDLDRLIWDNGNYNVWMIPAAACLSKAKADGATPHS
jgi:Tol biopolymer transport system component